MKKNLTHLDIQDKLAIIYMNNPPNNLINNQVESSEENVVKVNNEKINFQEN